MQLRLFLHGANEPAPGYFKACTNGSTNLVSDSAVTLADSSYQLFQ